MTVWVNGRRGGAIDARDRGLHYGDGVFETLRVHRRRIRLLDFHLERLRASCRRLGIAAADPGRLGRELECAAANRREAVLN